MHRSYVHACFAFAVASAWFGACFGQGSLRSARAESAETAQSAAADTPAPKIPESLRAKAASEGTVKVFLALSAKMDGAQLKSIKNRYAAQIRAFDACCPAVLAPCSRYGRMTYSSEA